MDYLPIGSVVLLKGMQNRTLIFGRCLESKRSGLEYDYIGCAYPQGIETSDQVRAFHHTDIETVYAIGYQNAEELRLQKQLKKRKEMQL